MAERNQELYATLAARGGRGKDSRRSLRTPWRSRAINNSPRRRCRRKGNSCFPGSINFLGANENVPGAEWTLQKKRKRKNERFSRLLSSLDGRCDEISNEEQRGRWREGRKETEGYRREKRKKRSKSQRRGLLSNMEDVYENVYTGRKKVGNWGWNGDDRVKRRIVGGGRGRLADCLGLWPIVY